MQQPSAPSPARKRELVEWVRAVYGASLLSRVSADANLLLAIALIAHAVRARMGCDCECASSLRFGRNPLRHSAFLVLLDLNAERQIENQLDAIVEPLTLLPDVKARLAAAELAAHIGRWRARFDLAQCVGGLLFAESRLLHRRRSSSLRGPRTASLVQFQTA